MKKKKLISIIAAVSMIITLTACGNSNQNAAKDSAQDTSAPPSSSSDESGSFTIGFSNCSQDTPFFANMTPIIEDYAKEKGIEVISLNADNDTSKQNKDMQDLISRGIDILIINPVNEDGATAGIEACNKNDIPVITVDKNVTKGNTAWVGRDNQVMGRLVGERLIELLGGEGATGTVLEIQGTAGSTTMMNRRDGFHEALEKAPGLKIVQSSYCDYDRSKAIPATQDLLQANKDVVAIFGHNDDMALGAAQVCKEQKLDNVLVCGVDGLMEAVLKIETGEYHCTSSNDPVLLGQTAVDAAIDLMAGKTLDEFIDAGTVVIDQENIAEYANKDLDFATMVK